MFASLSALLFASSVLAVPLIEQRAVQKLDQAAFDEAQQRDASATRAFSSTEIKVRKHPHLHPILTHSNSYLDLEWAVPFFRYPLWRLSRQPDAYPSCTL